MRERGLYSPKFNKLNKSKMLSAKRSREFHSSGTSTPSIDTSRDPSLSFNASYLLNTSAWAPKIKWTPREFIRPFRLIKYDVICEAYFVQRATIGWKGFSQTNNNSRTLGLCITYTFLKFDLWQVVKSSQNIFELKPLLATRAINQSCFRSAASLRSLLFFSV